MSADLPEQPDAATGPRSAPRLLTEPAEGVPPVAAAPLEIANVARALSSGTGPVAIDAERAGGYRYDNRAYLVQLRRNGSGTQLVDPIDTGDLSGIAAVIGDQEWILHAASQDLACLAELNLRPSRLFDTEVAARLLGKPKVGLAGLAESELGISLKKAHSAADWSTRPLPTDWLRYAALDVEFLIELRDILLAELIELGRLPWAQEEFEYVRTAPAKEPRREPWRRTSGIHRIRSAPALAIVASVWQARDDLARRRDIAPGRVLPDSAICAAALAAPKTQAQLAALPEFSGRGTRRRIDYWWEAVRAGQDTPREQLPTTAASPTGPPPPRTWTEKSPPAAVRLAAAKKGISALNAELGIPVENIISPDSVRRLCWSPPDDHQSAVVADELRSMGARQWQIDLTATLLAQALSEAES